jgi:tetratricopeptide (TPR) repeat protein
MGDVDEGIAYYHQALAIDPDNLDTREYLGEGYVAAGRTDLAEIELARLETLCGADCGQYEALAAAIAGEPEQWGGQ